MKAVIVDMGNPRLLRVLGVSLGKNSRVLWHEQKLCPQETGAEWKLVHEMLNQRLALNWPICWIPCREQVGAAVLTLPPIPKREIIKILPREVAQVTESSQTLATAFVLGEALEEKGVVKQEVIAVYIPQKALYETLDHVRSLGLNLRWVLPEMTGHLHFLKNLQATLTEPLSGTVLFEVDTTKIAMTIYRQLAWGLERVFTYRLESSGHLSDEELSRISVELNRALQFFKQRYRRMNVDRLVIYGDSSAYQQIADHIKANHALHIINAFEDSASARLDISESDPQASESLSQFFVPLQLIPFLNERQDLDLFPLGYQERDRLKPRMLGLGVSLGVIATVLAVATFYLLGVTTDYRLLVKELGNTIAQQQMQNQQMFVTRNRRTFFYQWEHFKLWPKRYTTLTTDFIRQLTLMVTPEIRLSELTVDPKVHGAEFILKGHISASDSFLAQSKFIQFFDQIKALPNMVLVDSSNVKVNTAENTTGPAYTAQALPKSSTVELYFSINGEIEWL